MKNKYRSKNTLEKRGKVVSTFSGISGGLSFLGGWQICHNLCLGIVTVLSLIGITIVGMPLLFLTQYAVYFWIIALFLLIPTLILYWQNRKCMSKNLLLANMGIVIASVPFDFLQSYNILLWTVGGTLVGISIFSYVKSKFV